MARFFMAGTNLMGGTAVITGRDAEHLQVLRVRPGEDVTICDGQGTDYKCRLLKANREEAELEIVEVTPCKSEPDVQVTVLCGLPKGSDKVDYIIQKCVEAGAREIMFFQSNRCVAKPEKIENKIERWRRISEEAAKQSHRGIIPAVYYIGDYTEALNVAAKSDLSMLMYETGEREALSDVLEGAKPFSTVSLLTGPEGGFAEFEVKLAKAVGLHICSMGERILRCETAPVVAVSAVMYATGNL